jgi:site-specific recombinase XerD
LLQVDAFAKHFGKSPDELGPEDVRAWQVHLLEVKKLTPNSIGIAASALRFLYKVTLKREWAVEEIPLPKQPFKLPVILSREEVTHFFECIGSLKHRTILMTAYAGGLRISEVTQLKISDIDIKRNR